MLDRLNKYPPNYTPLLTGVATAGGIYLGLVPLMLVGLRLPVWVWWSALVLPLVGAVLQFGTTRVIYMREYEVVAYGLSSATFGVLTWAVLVFGKAELNCYMGLVIAIMLILIAVVSGVLLFRDPQRAEMPCGPRGKLDLRTGLIVDPFFSETTPRPDRRSETVPGWVLRTMPLVAGLSLALVRGLPDSTEMLFLLIPGVGMSALTAGAAGAACSYLIATLRWERWHGKQIHVKR